MLVDFLFDPNDPPMLTGIDRLWELALLHQSLGAPTSEGMASSLQRGEGKKFRFRTTLIDVVGRHIGGNRFDPVIEIRLMIRQLCAYIYFQSFARYWALNLASASVELPIADRRRFVHYRGCHLCFEGPAFLPQPTISMGHAVAG